MFRKADLGEICMHLYTFQLCVRMRENGNAFAQEKSFRTKILVDFAGTSTAY